MDHSGSLYFISHSSLKAIGRPFVKTARPWFRPAPLLRPVLAALGAPAPSTDHPGGSSLVATGCSLRSDRGAAGHGERPGNLGEGPAELVEDSEGMMF